MQKQSIQTLLINNRYASYVCTFVFAFAAVVFGISMGSTSIPFFTTVSVLCDQLFHVKVGNPADVAVINIIMSIRFPRVVLAFLVGTSLSLAGAAFQGLLKNPLADPYTLGVSSGGALGAVFVLFFQIQLPLLGAFTLPFISITASIAALFLVLLFVRLADKRMTIESFILTGIIMSSFFGALLSLLIALTGEELRNIISWLLGSVSMRGWDYIKLIFPFTLVSFFVLLLLAKDLNAISFGEESALHLGVNVVRTKSIVLICASILTGAAVAVSGTIGFVGLVIPHVTRMIWGPNHIRLLPLSALTGGAFLVLADLVSRTIIAPAELPIGVITAIIGAPIFALLFIQRNRKRK
ncbi:iron ABC transporter permease [Bacillus sp. 165]|uniref:FecCD family ABC transporter permease n=1 Tax=Bacillus sp. 165 TaxID=1529117 RepID=UPI001ADB7F8C|nr:iron ABC transporter permease [Bacillus sp. 165]MBO9128289.1 iron ABC transporter permease [Bacillus sp. 165]